MNSPKIFNASLFRQLVSPSSSPGLSRRNASPLHHGDVSTNLNPLSHEHMTTSPRISPRLDSYIRRNFCSTVLANHHIDLTNEIAEDKSSLGAGEAKVRPATVSPLQWAWQGSKHFVTKTPEQYWKDLQDNRKELAWSQLERVHRVVHPSEEDANSTQWFNNWKENNVGVKTSQRSTTTIDMAHISSKPKLSYSPSEIQIINKSHSVGHTDSSSIASPPTSPDDHRAFFDSLGKKFGVRSLDDWYSINITDVQSFEQHQVLPHYGNSLIQALMTIYPDHPWKIWKFDASNKGLFNDEPDRQPIDKAIEDQFGTSRSEDFNTTMSRLKDHWQVRLFSPTKGDSSANQASPFMRPNPIGDPDSLLDIPHKSNELRKVVQRIFSKADMQFEYSSPNLIYSDTKRPFTLDVYIPDMALAFEYIEDPNLSWQYAFGANYSIYAFHKAKHTVCEKLGITLIEVPSWWKRDQSSLISAIKRIRPDLSKSIQSN